MLIFTLSYALVLPAYGKTFQARTERATSTRRVGFDTDSKKIEEEERYHTESSANR